MPIVHPFMTHCPMECSLRTDIYHRHLGRRVDILSLPPELILNILEELDVDSVRSCLLTCRRWRHVSERVIYGSPRLSSAAAMERFISVLERKEHLRGFVKHLHIRGKANYSSTRPTDWILDAPRRLAPLLPNVRSLTFENVENVPFTRHEAGKTIWGDLERFGGVTELHVNNCRFEFAQDLRHLIFSFPSLTTLTLSHVRWGWQPTVDPSGWQPLRWQRLLPLKTLRLAYLPSVSEYEDAFTWFGRLNAVCELQLEQIPSKALWVLSKYLTRLADSGGSLESFTFCPLITPGCGFAEYVPCFGQALKAQRNLSELDFRIVSLQAMRWVPMVFDAARDLPISRVALEFTLDIENAAKPSRAFIETNERLCQYWLKSLRQVTFVDHPTGHWVPVADVPNILSTRCPSLVERGILDVRIGVRYEDF